MVYAVQGFFGFRNTARRDGVMQNVQTRLTTEITWGDVITQSIDSGPRLSDPSMFVEVRFTTEAARDSFWTDIIAFLGTGVNGPVTGSYIQQHDCSHNERFNVDEFENEIPDTVADCVISERIDY